MFVTTTGELAHTATLCSVMVIPYNETLIVVAGEI